MHLLNVALGLVAAQICSGLPSGDTKSTNRIISKRNLNVFEDEGVKRFKKEVEEGWRLGKDRPFINADYGWETSCQAGAMEFYNKLRIREQGVKVNVRVDEGPSIWSVTNTKGKTDIIEKVEEKVLEGSETTKGWSVGLKKTWDAGVKEGPLSASSGWELSAGYKDETTTRRERVVITSNTYTCPMGHACQVIPVSFTLQVEGDCDVIPMTNYLRDGRFVDACINTNGFCEQTRAFTANRCHIGSTELYPTRKCSFEVPVTKDGRLEVVVARLFDDLGPKKDPNADARLARHIGYWKKHHDINKCNNACITVASKEMWTDSRRTTCQDLCETEIVTKEEITVMDALVNKSKSRHDPAQCRKACGWKAEPGELRRGTVKMCEERCSREVPAFATLYAGGMYQGEAIGIVTEPGKCFDVPAHFNDVTKSVLVERPSTWCNFYEHIGCTGNAVTVYREGDFSDTFRGYQNMISSVECGDM